MKIMLTVFLIAFVLFAAIALFTSVELPRLSVAFIALAGASVSAKMLLPNKTQ